MRTVWLKTGVCQIRWICVFKTIMIIFLSTMLKSNITTIFTTANIPAWLVFHAERARRTLLRVLRNAKVKRNAVLGKKDILGAKKLLKRKNLLQKRKNLKKVLHRLAILTFCEDYQLKFDQNFPIAVFGVLFNFQHDLTKTPVFNQTVRIKTLCFFFDTFFVHRVTCFSAFTCIHFEPFLKFTFLLPSEMKDLYMYTFWTFCEVHFSFTSRDKRCIHVYILNLLWSSLFFYL